MPSPSPIEIKPLAVYTVTQACQRLGWGRKALYKAVRLGHLPVIREGKGWRVLGEDLLKLAKPIERPA